MFAQKTRKLTALISFAVGAYEMHLLDDDSSELLIADQIDVVAKTIYIVLHSPGQLKEDCLGKLPRLSVHRGWIPTDLPF